MASSCLPALQDMNMETKLSRIYYGFQTPTFDGMWTLHHAGASAADAVVTEEEDASWKFDPAAANNGESGAYTKKIFVLRDGVSFAASALIKATQAATNKMGIYFGFTDTPGAGVLADTTLAPVASMIGFSLYATTGDTVWYCGAENGSTREETASTLTAGGATRPNGTNRHLISLDVKCVGTEAICSYHVNHNYMTSNASLRTLVMQKSFTFGTTNTALALELCVKNGSGVNQLMYAHSVAFAKTLRMP